MTWSIHQPETLRHVALGSFVDAVFPPPTVEFATKFRHLWVRPIPEAIPINDPTGADDNCVARGYGVARA
jgi:hypothetical protein